MSKITEKRPTFFQLLTAALVVFFFLAVFPQGYPGLSFYLIALAVSLFIGVLFARIPRSRLENLFKSIPILDQRTRTILFFTVGCGLLAGIFYWVSTRVDLAFKQGVGDVDFYCYVFMSRLDDFQRIFYPPGIFHFYQTIMRLGVTDSQGLYLSNIVFILVNAVLIAAILLRLNVSVWISIWAALWSVFVVEFFQGYFGIIEPFISGAVLFWILLAAGQGSAWTDRNFSLIALGLGCGLGMYFKQQGVIYLIAIPCALMICRDSTETKRVTTRKAVIVVGAALGMLLILLSFEKGPLLQLLESLIRAGAEYPIDSRNTLYDRFTGSLGRDPKLTFVTATWVIVLCWWRINSERRKWFTTPQGSMFVLALLLGIAPIIQLVWRGYDHYLLMAWPFIILSTAVGVDRFYGASIRIFPHRWETWTLFLVFLLPFTRIAGDHGPWLLPPYAADPKLKVTPINPDWKEAVGRIRPVLKENSEIVVAPSRYMYFFWELNARHPLGDYMWYEFPSKSFKEALKSEKTDLVLIAEADGRGQEWLSIAKQYGYQDIQRNQSVTWLGREKQLINPAASISRQ